RFHTALLDQLLRSFQNKKIYIHGIALAGNVDNALLAGSGKFSFPSPKWPPNSPTPNLLTGSSVGSFDTAKDSSEQIDFPGAPARAFRDYKGTIHLISS